MKRLADERKTFGKYLETVNKCVVFEKTLISVVFIVIIMLSQHS